MFLRIAAFLLTVSSTLPRQSQIPASVGPQLPAHATLPITFTKTTNAAKAKAGDRVEAKTRPRKSAEIC